MNYIAGQTDGPVRLSGKDNIISGIIKEKITSSLLEILKPGSIVDADLISVSSGEAGSPSGILNINGKLLTAVIPESLYDEFTLGKAFDESFGIPVKLRLESSVKNIPLNENAGAGVEIVFKVVADAADDLNIQKVLDLYSKAFTGGLEGDIGAAFKSFSASGLSASIQNVTAEVKGNFLFVHINFGTGFGSGSVILTSERARYIKDAPDKKKSLSAAPKKYMLMLETEFNLLGRIKLFSYYSAKFLSVKFQECPAAARELINKNLESFKEMLSKDGITLKDISFKADAGTFASGGETFYGGKIIDERV
jgi:hypothetical protein